MADDYGGENNLFLVEVHLSQTATIIYNLKSTKRSDIVTKQSVNDINGVVKLGIAAVTRGKVCMDHIYVQ